MAPESTKRRVAYVERRSKPIKGDGLKSLTFFTVSEDGLNSGVYYLGFNSRDFYDSERLEREFKHLVKIDPPELISPDEKVFINDNGTLLIAKKEKPDDDDDARMIGAFKGKHHQQSKK